jgi:hypothetical protein
VNRSRKRLVWSGAAWVALLLAACAAPADLPQTGPTGTALPPTSVPTATGTSIPEEEASMTSTTPPTADSNERAPNANVTFVQATQSGDGSWRFRVTVEHLDTGWEDYADGWDVVLPDGTVVKPAPDSPFTRLLLHPHVDEQPFTRSQGGIVIPDGVTQMTVRAHDLVDGFGGREVLLDLSTGSGPDFEVAHAQ